MSNSKKDHIEIVDLVDTNLTEEERRAKLMQKKLQSQSPQLPIKRCSEFNFNESFPMSEYNNERTPCIPQYNDVYDMNQIGKAGIKRNNALSLNNRRICNDMENYKEAISAEIEINKRLSIAQIEIDKDRQKKWNDLQYIELLQKIKDGTYEASQFSDGTINIVKRTFDFTNIEKGFDEKYKPVKERSNFTSTGWEYRIRSIDDNRYLPTDKNNMYNLFLTYVYDNINDDEYIEEIKLKRSFDRIFYRIKPLDKSDLRILKNEEIMFKNGIYNILSGDFEYLLDTMKCYNTFSILLDFDENYTEPLVFDAMLDDMFGGNEEMKQLAYEIIGALISMVLLKNIFIFQGKSQGGKTRLANKIIKLLDEIGVYSCNDITEISDDWLKKNGKNFRLINVKDSVDKKMSAKQRSNLKGFADGGGLSSDVPFKILICSNHEIYTGEKGFIEKALLNRFVVLPFPKPMDNSDERVANYELLYFEKEKPAIVCKSLKAFQKVLKNGMKFSGNFKINECVEDSEDDIESEQKLNEEEHLAIENIKQQNHSQPSKLEHIINVLFVTTDEADPNMTTGYIADLINKIDSSLNVSPEIIGNTLSDMYGKKLIKNRNSAGYYYGLALRNNQ